MISAIILTKNEELNIIDCLETLKWCDEIIVIDDYSTDLTAELALKQKFKLYKHNLNNDFSSARNFGLEKANGDWILFVDADERVSKALKTEIQSSVVNSNFDGFYIRRIDHIFGRKLRFGEFVNTRLLRLAKKNKSSKWVGKVHESWEISGNIGLLNSPLIHFPHPSITLFLAEINFYSTIRARELYEQKIKANWYQIILYPLSKFVLNFILKGGFKDQIPGLIAATMMSYHSYLVRAKLWRLWQQKIS